MNVIDKVARPETRVTEAWIESKTAEYLSAAGKKAILDHGAKVQGNHLRVALLTSREQAALRSDNDSLGGTLQPANVSPDTFAAHFHLALRSHDPLRRGGAEVLSLDGEDKGDSYPLPTVDDTSSEGMLLIPDDVSIGTADPVTGAAVLYSYGWSSKFIRVSRKVARQSKVFQTLLPRLLGERIARVQGRMFTVGADGTGPRGILNEVTTGVTAAQAGNATLEELQDLIESVDTDWMEAPTGGLMMHASVYYDFARMIGGDGHFRNRPRRYGEPPNLLGHRVHFNRHMASAFATGATTVLAGDFSAYKIAEWGALELQTLTELYAGSSEVAFAATLYGDGCLATAGSPIKALVHP